MTLPLFAPTEEVASPPPKPVITLRDYQRECLEAVRSAYLRGVKRQLITMCTGTGKTNTFSMLPATLGLWPVLIMMDRNELVEQNAATFQRLNPHATVTIEKAERVADIDADCVIASAPTWMRDVAHNERLRRFRPDHFALIIEDEAHHSLSQKRLAILSYFQPRLLTGWTATPMRGDGKPLARLYDEITYSLSKSQDDPLGLQRCINDGWLTRIRAFRIRTTADISNVKAVRGGDFHPDDLAKAINTDFQNSLIISGIEQHAADRRAIMVFCANKAHAEAMAYQLVQRGHNAACVLDHTPYDERSATMAAFRAGEKRILVVVGIGAEGFDAPIADCAVFARPIKSPTLWIQCLDEETQILTERGWIGISDPWLETDRAATFDPTTGTWGWESATRCERLLGDERFWGIQNPHLDIRVTAGHRMVSRPRKTKDWALVRADAMPLYGSIPVSAMPTDDHDAAIPDHDLKFIGYVLSDGHVSKSNHIIAISQSTHHADTVADIRATIIACGFKYREFSRQDPTNFGPRKYPLLTWVISRGTPRGTDKHLTGWGRLGDWLVHGKRITPAFEKLSQRQVAVFLSTLFLGNGGKFTPTTWTPHTLTISVAHQELADQLQSLLVRRGYRCNIAPTPSRCRILHISKQATWSLCRHASDGRPVWAEQPPDTPTRRVWCISTQQGIIFTRRHGKVAIVGNCLGRVLRPYPGKVDALVLDVAFIVGTHKICNLGELFGCRDYDALGGDVMEIAAKVKKISALGLDIPEGADADTIALFAETADRIAQGTIIVDTVAEAADLFSSISFAAEVERDSHFAWIKVAGRRYQMSLPADASGHRVATLYEDALGVWQYTNGTTTIPLGTREKGAPFREADRCVKQDCADNSWRVVANDAAWRNAPATDKQKALLTKFGIKALPPDLTKGAAAHLADILILSAKNRRRNG